MKVYHFDGLDECLTEDELGSLLEARFGARANEFLLAGDSEYPYLAILVNDGYSAMVYFPEDRESMFQAIGGNTALSVGETSVFYSGTPDQEMEVWNEFVLPFALAKEAALEFFATLSMPTCVEWSKQ